MVHFSPADWLVVAGYLGVVLAIGAASGRRATGRDEFFLAGRSMPAWAVTISILATAQSAATFVGAPQQSYKGDLTYLSANLGALVAVVLTAVFFVPAFYRHGVTSIYELLGHELGTGSQKAASAAFMVGRVFASGARLFIAGIPFALVAFGDTQPRHLLLAIGLVSLVATGYTLAGGIRAVIWTDVLQATLYVGAVAVALGWLLSLVPAGLGEVVEALRASDGGSKLTVIDAGLDLTFSRPYNLWAVLLGLSLLNLAAYGTDQDLTQRMLTCRSAARGSWSVIASAVICWPVVALFLVLGLLLHVYYLRPDLMGAAAPDYEIGDSSRVFIDFIVHEMPPGLRGLMVAGLFATTMSSLDSALNAMASATIADFYRPARRGEIDPARELAASRIAVVGWSAALTGFAALCVFWHDATDQALIDFALNVMVFAYSGLLAVFLTALFTRRGNSATAIAALAAGFTLTLLMQEGVWKHWAPLPWRAHAPAFGWTMLLATSLSFAICAAGRRRTAPGALLAADANGRRG